MNCLMKKAFVILVLFPILISFNSYGGWFDKNETVCGETDTQIRNGIIYLPNETEPFTGKYLCEYENGQIKSQGKFKDGKPKDKRTKWYENGQIQSEVRYNKDGKQVGKMTSWYENGQVKSQGKFKDGKKDGKWTWWYENGLIKEENNLKDGIYDGKWTTWFENGQKESERNFKWQYRTTNKGTYYLQHGKQISWYENGQIEKETTFKDGKCISGDC